MRVIGLTLLALILISNIDCSGNLQRNPAAGNSQQTNSDQWQPYQSIPGGFRRILVGDPRQPGPFKFQLKVPAKAHVAVHQHAIDVQVKVLSGTMVIIIGEPIESSRAQHFTAGSVFTVPAHTWHEEWWDEESVMQAEGLGPMETIFKSP